MPFYEQTSDFINNGALYVINYEKSFTETYFLGHIELFGYWNKLNAKSRIWSALVQTIWSTLALAGLYKLLAFLLEGNSIFSASTDKLDCQSFTSITLFISAVFGAVFWREQKDLHEKWLYLSALYNDIQKLPAIDPSSNFDSRELARTALVIDALHMGMWAHRSFYPTINSVIERAIIHNYKGKQISISNRLKKSCGEVDYDEICFFLSNYVDYLLSFSPETSAEKLYRKLNNY